MVETSYLAVMNAEPGIFEKKGITP